jgi:hypothetical protein
MSSDDTGRVKSATASVPMAWMLGALWTITMALAGWWAQSVQSDVASIARTTIDAERVNAATSVRLDALEEAGSNVVTSREVMEILRRLERLETKVDDIRSGQRPTRQP